MHESGEEPPANRVRAARLSAGFSQEALARRVGVSRQTIVNIEHGSEPRVRLALGIAAALGVSPNRLFGDADLLWPLTARGG